MSLTTMTPEWKNIADEIMIFVIRKRQLKDPNILAFANDASALYNWWANERGYAIRSVELALWCTDYIQSLVATPLPKLIKAAEIDNLQF